MKGNFIILLEKQFNVRLMAIEFNSYSHHFPLLLLKNFIPSE